MVFRGFLQGAGSRQHVSRQSAGSGGSRGRGRQRQDQDDPWVNIFFTNDHILGVNPDKIEPGCKWTIYKIPNGAPACFCCINYKGRTGLPPSPSPLQRSSLIRLTTGHQMLNYILCYPAKNMVLREANTIWLHMMNKYIDFYWTLPDWCFVGTEAELEVKVAGLKTDNAGRVFVVTRTTKTKTKKTEGNSKINVFVLSKYFPKTCVWL